MTTPQPPAAILWDMDGTLVDTEPYWIGAEHELMQEHGASWSHEDALGMVGLPLTKGAEILREHGKLSLTIDEIVTRLAGQVNDKLAHETPWRPGAYEALKCGFELGIPMALVTMSYEFLAQTFATSIGFAAFETLVTGDMVTNGKPHPESYLLAATRLNVAITDCVAVEDSRPGVAAAVASGAHTIAVPHMVPIAPSDALSVFTSLTEFTPETLYRVAGGERLHLGTGQATHAH